MTEYPRGVAQNYAPPNCPLELRPVAESNWRMFSDAPTAEKGFGMIDALCSETEMVDAATIGGMYEQFYYLDPLTSDIRCRIVNGTANDSSGPMKISEYPADIVDRDSTPMSMVDLYAPGQPHILKVRRLTPGPKGLGQLYFEAV